MFLAEIRRRCKNVDIEKADEFCVCMCFITNSDDSQLMLPLCLKITMLVHITTFILCIIQMLVLTTGT